MIIAIRNLTLYWRYNELQSCYVHQAAVCPVCKNPIPFLLISHPSVPCSGIWELAGFNIICPSCMLVCPAVPNGGMMTGEQLVELMYNAMDREHSAKDQVGHKIKKMGFKGTFETRSTQHGNRWDIWSAYQGGGHWGFSGGDRVRQGHIARGHGGMDLWDIGREWSRK